MSLRTLTKHVVTIGFAIGATLSIGSCGKNPVTGDNSQNSVDITAQSTGQIAVASFTEQDSLSATLATAGSGLDNMSLDNKFSISSASGLGKSGLGKTHSGEPATTIDFSDTGKGIIRLMYFKQELLSKNYDTLVVKWDDVAKDTSKTTKNIISVSGSKEYIGGKVERYSVVDLDNDGVVSGESKYNGQARFTYQSITAAATEKLVMDVSAGADKDFNTDADNQVIALSWEKTTIAGKVAWASFTDADGDGILIDKSKLAKSAVDVVLFEKNPTLKPFVDSSILNLRVLTNGKSSDDLLTRLSGVEYRKSGRIITVTASDIHGNPDIMPNDTAVVTFAKSPKMADGWKDSATFVFSVGSGLQNSNDNLFSEIHLSKDHQAGVVLSKTFDFTTTQAFAAGQQPKSGHLVMTVTYGNGKTASIVADFNQNGFSGTWTGPNGNSVQVSWDAGGNVK